MPFMILGAKKANLSTECVAELTDLIHMMKKGNDTLVCREAYLVYSIHDVDYQSFHNDLILILSVNGGKDQYMHLRCYDRLKSKPTAPGGAVHRIRLDEHCRIDDVNGNNYYTRY